MGDASRTPTLKQLREILLADVGKAAKVMPDAAKSVVGSMLEWWPSTHMTILAKSKTMDAGIAASDAIDVLKAKCREDLEFHWGTHANVGLALDALLEPVAMSLADYWFESVDNRNTVRACMKELRDRRQ